MDYEGNPCQDVRELLAGTWRAEYFADVEELRQHWEDCATCRMAFPNANAEIQKAEYRWLCQIKRNIDHLCREYASSKDAMLQPTPNKPEPVSLAIPRTEVMKFEARRESEGPTELQTLYASLLTLLSEKGEAIRELLQTMNDNWGLDYFRLAFEDAHDSCEYVSRVCGSLISSLSSDVQRFVFQSIITADVLESFDINSSPQSSCKLYKTLEYAAPEFLRLYLEGQEVSVSAQDMSRSLSEREAPKDLSLLMDKINNITENLEDGVDSIKAGQMELCRLSKPNTYNATEIEEDLVNHFGKELFGRLTFEARRCLNDAEFLFRQSLNTEMKDFRGSLTDFHAGYEHEFRYRISRPVARSLSETGCTNYPSTEGGKKFLRESKFNGNLTLGDQIWFLFNDERVRNIVTGLNFSVEEVQRCASRICQARNKAAHEDRSVVTELDVRQVRDTLRDGFRALFPQRHTP